MPADFSTAALRQALERVSDETKAAVLKEMDRAATSLVSALQAGYPSRTGALRRGVTKRTARSFGFFVRSAAPHVHFIEQGTRDRYDATRGNAYRGRMRAKPTFIPAAVLERRTFLRRAEDLLRRNRELV